MTRVLVWMLNGLAYIPLRGLYVLSDILFVLCYYVARYRRKVVMKNLTLCFPEKSERELKRISRQFYHHLTDYFVETVKLAHVTDEDMLRRFSFKGIEVIDEHLAKGRSVAVYFSHCFNWEWAPSITLHSRYRDDRRVDFCQVYKPLNNKVLDGWFLKLRSRFGSVSLKRSGVIRDLMLMRREGRLNVTGFMSDQRSQGLDPGHLVTLLGRPTVMITGTEVLARKLGMAAVYWDIQRLGRGRYELTVRPMCDNSAALEVEFELTDMYAQMLEQTIRRDPTNWLWSHDRWKRPIPPGQR